MLDEDEVGRVVALVVAIEMVDVEVMSDSAPQATRQSGGGGR
jgi:hypothetical protein